MRRARAAYRSWIDERLTPVERRALELIVAAWTFGVVAGWAGWPDALSEYSQHRLDPPLPAPAELAARLPPGDMRPRLLAAGLALGEERRQAAAGPRRIDPNAADRAAWDRLPGIGPRTAITIIDHRDRFGPFRRPEDLLDVRGIGPATLARLRPWIDESSLAGMAAPPGSGPLHGRLPDLNGVDGPFLAAIPEIGPKLARSIVSERSRRRGFRNWAEVLAIRGIGEKKLGRLREVTSLHEGSR